MNWLRLGSWGATTSVCELGVPAWEEHAATLIREAHVEFRWYSGSFEAAFEAMVELARRQDPRADVLLREVYAAAIVKEWSGWDVPSQNAELLAAVGRLDEARALLDLLVESLRSRFAPYV